MSTNRRRMRLIALGLCMECGKAQPRETSKFCQSCHQARVERNRPYQRLRRLGLPTPKRQLSLKQEPIAETEQKRVEKMFQLIAVVSRRAA